MSPMRLPLLVLVFSTAILCGAGFPGRLSSIQENDKNPIILIPGLGGSQIEAKLNKTSTPHPFLCFRKSDWYQIWVSPIELLPWFIDCFKDNFRRVVDMKTGKTSNSPGVSIRVAEWGKTDGIESISSCHVLGSGGSCKFVSKKHIFLLLTFLLNLHSQLLLKPDHLLDETTGV